MSADRKNFFAALVNADEIIAKHEEQNTESKKESEKQIGHLRQPLIWIDLEMTGESTVLKILHVQIFFFDHMPATTTAAVLYSSFSSYFP